MVLVKCLPGYTVTPVTHKNAAQENHAAMSMLVVQALCRLCLLAWLKTAEVAVLGAPIWNLQDAVKFCLATDDDGCGDARTSSEWFDFLLVPPMTCVFKYTSLPAKCFIIKIHHKHAQTRR